jgi:hypothetical protein
MKFYYVVSECGAYSHIIIISLAEIRTVDGWMMISGEEKPNKDNSLQASQSHINRWIIMSMFLHQQLGQRFEFAKNRNLDRLNPMKLTRTNL